MHFPWINAGDVRHLYSIYEGKASKRFSTVQTFSLPLGILTQLNFTARLLGRFLQRPPCYVFRSFATSPSAPPPPPPPSPATEINNLIALVRSFNLTPSLETTLVGKLQDALAAVNAGNTAAACTSMSSFITKVQSQSDKKVDPDEKSQMITSANQIKTHLGCP